MNLKSVKVMLLGILIMLLGGALLVDPTTNMGGIELVITAVGFIVGVAGFFLPG